MKNKFLKKLSILAFFINLGIILNGFHVYAWWKIENDTLIIHNEKAMHLFDNYNPEQQRGKYKHIIINGQMNTFDVTILETMSRKCVSVNLLNTTLDRIPDNAFFMMSNLETFVFPEHLKVIGKGAFYYCSNLQVETLPLTLEQIRGGAFMYCKNLDLIVPNCVKIGDRAFGHCPNIHLSGNSVTSNTNPSRTRVAYRKFLSFLLSWF